MKTPLPTHDLVAFNTATASENKIHDDSVASSFGFTGGLVPGVDVYAYLCRPAIGHWGERFCASARVTARFDRPVFDGDRVRVESRLDDDGQLRAEVISPTGPCASLVARIDNDPGAPEPAAAPVAIGTAPLPTERPPASPTSLAAGTRLGSYETTCDDDDLVAYLHDVRDDDSPVGELGLVHPGWLLRQANYALSRNVVLGPWIHVGSVVTNHRPVATGEPLSIQARVERRFEHKGHGFVTLHVTMVGPDGNVRCTVAHTAIYEPRQVRDLTG